MKVKDLIDELLKIEDIDSEVFIVGNDGAIDDSFEDVNYTKLEIWSVEDKNEVTLFFYNIE